MTDEPAHARVHLVTRQAQLPRPRGAGVVLDACEPELEPGHHANLVFDAGPGAEVAGIYPRDNARMFAEGMAAAANGAPGDAETVLLCRSAWAGQQKYSAAVWSGDIPATWDSLRRQVRAGLSIAIAGIPWWTTDIGGFHGGDASDEDFRELVVRWFQYGAFCPLFRLHGDREPRTPTGWDMTGGPNEVWAFGDEAYQIIKDVMLMRERLRPYLHEHLDRASSEGLPAMRPLFVDFADDERAWTVEDEFMFGPDVLVAPVTEAGARSRQVRRRSPACACAAAGSRRSATRDRGATAGGRRSSASQPRSPASRSTG